MVWCIAGKFAIACSLGKFLCPVEGMVCLVPAADVVNGMMYEPMESRSSILILIHTGNIFITGPIMEALTIPHRAYDLGEAILTV